MLAGRGSRNGFAFLVVSLLVAAVLQLPAGARASTVINPFAGNWTTSGGPTTGTLSLQVVSSALGQQAVAKYGNGYSCPSHATYYYGTWSGSTNGDSGVAGGCTDASGTQLNGAYKSNSTNREGFFVITTSSDLNSFSGNSAEQTTSVTVPFTGTFAGDFSGDGRDSSSSGVGGSGTGGTGGSAGGGSGTGGSGGSAGGGSGTGGSGGSAGGSSGTVGGSSGSSGSTVPSGAGTTQPGPAPGPPATDAEQEAVSATANRQLYRLYAYCMLRDPHGASNLCELTSAMAGQLIGLQHDTPNPSYRQVLVAQLLSGGPVASLLCPTACPAAVPSINAYLQQLTHAVMGLKGLVSAEGCYSTAKATGATTSMRVQAAAADAYAGVLVNAVTGLETKATAVVRALAKTGETVALTRAQIADIHAQLLQRGLPESYVLQLPVVAGLAQEITQHLLAATSNPVGPVSFTQILFPGLAPGPFTTANRSITVAQVSALIQQLANQNELSPRTDKAVRGYLTALTRAHVAAQEAGTLTNLRRFVAGLSGPVATLLQAAAAGL